MFLPRLTLVLCALCCMTIGTDCAYCTGESSVEVKIEADSDEGNDISEHPRDFKPRHHLCTLCDKRFTTWSALKRHNLIHTAEQTGEKLYSCTQCEKRFPNEYYLKLHENVHSSKYKCTECGKGFRNSADLNRHMLCHSGEKPFECTVCSKRFTRSDRVSKHMTVHTGDKPTYNCSLCDKSFSRASNLEAHKRQVHSNRRDYKCQSCGKLLKNSRDLKYHARVHTGAKVYSCSHCSDSFTWLSQLKIHLLKSHNEGSWFTCHICQKKFVRSGDLKKHVACHEDRKPYVCSECPKCFLTIIGLQRHLLKH